MMAIGDKKSVVMTGDRAVPNGIATLDANGKLAQMPTPTDIGSPAMKRISQRLSATGWYRVGTLSRAGAWRFTCGGTYESNNMRWTIVDVVCLIGGINAVKALSTPNSEHGNGGITQIRFVKLANGVAVDIYYSYWAANYTSVACVAYDTNAIFTPAASMALITDEVTPAFTLAFT